MDDEINEATPGLPRDTADLVARIQREWSALLRAVERLSQEQMDAPGPGGWSVKDNLAHLTAWEQFMLRHYLAGQPAHEAMQVDEEAFKGLDEDGLNAVLHQRNRSRSVADVLAGLQRSHAQVVATLEGMPFTDLMRPIRPHDPRPVLAWVVGNTYEHYQEHRLAIQAMLAG